MSIAQAVARQVEGQQLSGRTFHSAGGIERDGYATAAGIAHEERLLRNEQSGRGVSPSIATPFRPQGSSHPLIYGLAIRVAVGPMSSAARRHPS